MKSINEPVQKSVTNTFLWSNSYPIRKSRGRNTTEFLKRLLFSDVSVPQSLKAGNRPAGHVRRQRFVTSSQITVSLSSEREEFCVFVFTNHSTNGPKNRSENWWRMWCLLFEVKGFLGPRPTCRTKAGGPARITTARAADHARIPRHTSAKLSFSRDSIRVSFSY